MRTKLLIFVFLMACFGLAVPTTSAMAASDMDTPVISSESPSAATLSRIENLGIGSDTKYSAMATTSMRLGRTANTEWDDLILPSSDSSAPIDVGDADAPIGDVTFPVALLALVIYFVYRGVTTSKRKSNL
ncbi:hypothetical protein D0T84_13740 [Dysgonomonas sp. 521]|uniref:hypothetical protein n=1 Tax=Dysgonomonas sp. 521 TaxID=2302932 RepID=UPI0013D2BF61|nr:hypothetical protein [Dysgonomonas sp. 521]NDV95965.1 hypothetical protein [Dysgonomonas sp. 521]